MCFFGSFFRFLWKIREGVYFVLLSACAIFG